MDQVFPYVVAVASEKGGVGKTTIATNLAVYLKALREDLPVTIASFDNHFSVDQMFAIGAHKGESVAGLFAGVPAAELVRLGEYGVQFLASERSLAPPDDDPLHLRRVLAAAPLAGILILDTRPILDYFTRNALLAADLVLVPVKDRASLVNAASLRQALLSAGDDPGKLWLVPSLVDARLRLRGEIGIRDFLVFAAGERGYQVTSTFIAKSPKVEGLATGFAARVHPVLTHARGTVVHGQLRELATFVLERCDATAVPLAGRGGLAAAAAGVSPGRARRLAAECPVCGKRPVAVGHPFFDLRSRRRGLVHPGCLGELLQEGGLADQLPSGGVLLLSAAGAGFTGAEAELTAHLFDAAGDEVAAEHLGDPAGSSFAALLENACGRRCEEFGREYLCLLLDPASAGDLLEGEGRVRFDALRRRALRDVVGQRRD